MFDTVERRKVMLILDKSNVYIYTRYKYSNESVFHQVTQSKLV